MLKLRFLLLSTVTLKPPVILDGKSKYIKINVSFKGIDLPLVKPFSWSERLTDLIFDYSIPML